MKHFKILDKNGKVLMFCEASCERDAELYCLHETKFDVSFKIVEIGLKEIEQAGDLEFEKLKENFKEMGFSEEGATVAAKGHDNSGPTTLKQEFMEMGMSEKEAEIAAAGRGEVYSEAKDKAYSRSGSVPFVQVPDMTELDRTLTGGPGKPSSGGFEKKLK